MYNVAVSKYDNLVASRKVVSFSIEHILVRISKTEQKKKKKKIQQN